MTLLTTHIPWVIWNDLVHPQRNAALSAESALSARFFARSDPGRPCPKKNVYEFEFFFGAQKKLKFLLNKI
jgi:hypothetical protein